MCDLRRKLWLSGIVPALNQTDIQRAVELCDVFYKAGFRTVELASKAVLAEVRRQYPDLILGWTADAGDSTCPEFLDFYTVHSGECAKDDARCFVRPMEKGILAFPWEGNVLQGIADAPSATGRWLEENKCTAIRVPFAGDKEDAKDFTRRWLKAILDLRLVHVGINSMSPEEDNAGFESLFYIDGMRSKNSVMYDDMVELMLHDGRGQAGHLAFSTPNIYRGIASLQRRGFSFDMDSRQFASEGSLNLIYLKEMIAGFAIHLIQEKEHTPPGKMHNETIGSETTG